MVCLLLNDEIKIRIHSTRQLKFIICLFCLFVQESIRESKFVDQNTN